MNGVSACIHCGRQVVQTVCPPDVWIHSDTLNVNCEPTIATPIFTETPAVLTGQVPLGHSETCRLWHARANNEGCICRVSGNESG